jgi:hypothetical protein
LRMGSSMLASYTAFFRDSSIAVTSYYSVIVYIATSSISRLVPTSTS